MAIDALWAATAATDMHLTQSCIQDHQCHEGNFLMPSNAAGQAAVVGGEAALGMWAFHRWHQSHPRLAWLIPAANIAAHGLGIWSFARKH